MLESARDVLAEAFGKPPDAPVRVSPWNGAGSLVVHGKRPYEILLTARDRYWCRYVYQFSYQLCHVMTGFDLCKGHRYKWFEGSLCELASLFVLYRLARVWVERPFPDILGAGEFAPNHRTYAGIVAKGYDRPVELPNGWARMSRPCKRILPGTTSTASWPSPCWTGSWRTRRYGASAPG